MFRFASHRFSAAYLSSFLVSLGFFNVANADEGRLSKDAQQVSEWLSGSFDSSSQASRDADYFNVSLKSCDVTVLDANDNAMNDAIYLYVEQAIAGRETAPYRQRVYRIGDAQNGGSSVVESEILTFEVPIPYIGFCSLPKGERILSRDALDNRGCSVFLKKEIGSEGDFRFTGRTPNGGCPSEFRGAVSVESYVSLGQNDLIAWDIGRDANGNQVWGPEKGPYIFVRK